MPNVDRQRVKTRRPFKRTRVAKPVYRWVRRGVEGRGEGWGSTGRAELRVLCGGGRVLCRRVRSRWGRSSPPPRCGWNPATTHARFYKCSCKNGCRKCYREISVGRLMIIYMVSQHWASARKRYHRADPVVGETMEIDLGPDSKGGV